MPQNHSIEAKAIDDAIKKLSVIITDLNMLKRNLYTEVEIDAIDELVNDLNILNNKFIRKLRLLASLKK